MNKILCPYCGVEQKHEPIKSWTYGKMIERRDKSGTKWGAVVTVTRYLCKCGKPFNFFLTTKNQSWTIPKRKLSN